ncbi:polyhydroxyalkanoate synthesis regulator [Paenibacillus sp. TRM 82003]|nr:polyhydroxyalkanoate synthesis regulator [Paenibacillus sp. TRM 82003]
MKDTIKKGLALGFGLAAASKEHAEKLVDELVRRGSLSREESRRYVDEMAQKGEEFQSELEQLITGKIREKVGELQLATKEDMQRLEQRLERLETRGTSPEQQ